MINNKFLFPLLFVAGLFVVACNGIDSSFEEKDSLRLISMETIDEPYCNYGEVYTYKLMAQATSGLKRVVISNISHEIDSLPSLPNIVMVDSVGIDSLGYFSKNIKTAIIEYPIIVPATPGEIISIDFTVTSVSGKAEKVSCSMLVANYKEGRKLFFVNTYKAKNWAFYSTAKDMQIGMTPTTSSYYKKNVEFADFYSISDGAKEYFIMSPDLPEIENYMIAHGDTNFVASEMRNTKLVKLENFNYAKARDKEILAIDFSNTTSKVQVKKGDVIGFITADGRKGVMNIIGASGRYIDFICKTQTIPQ